MPRIHCETPLPVGQAFGLPPGAARHVQVLRMQPGQTLTLFNGQGGEATARIERMGRSDVDVVVLDHRAVEREAARAVHLAFGLASADRLDWLVEKATELGAASLQPLATERSLLRLSGERSQKKQQHWQAVAVAACEQTGRNRVPVVHAPRGLAEWLAQGARTGAGLMLSPQGQQPLATASMGADAVWVLSGPEGGLSEREEALARDAGFIAVTLGERILRAETAPLAALALLTLG